MPKTKPTITKRVRYQSVLNLPPLPPDQFEALKANIAVHGVLVPILVDSSGPSRRIIDGSHRKRIAKELGYDCPEIIQSDLTEEECRTLARALNLARRQFTSEQKRSVIADQLRESGERSNRWIGKMLGVHHATVASVRGDLASTGQIIQLGKTVGLDGKSRSSKRKQPPTYSSDISRGEVSIIHGDCRSELQKIATSSVDLVLSDPIYPEIDKAYGRISELEWHDLMRSVVTECKRIVKPSGSAVFILQPNFRSMGQMRIWLWKFVVWAAEAWNLVQDVWWWAPNSLPTAATQRSNGLLRQSVKMCVWLGSPKCHRNQGRVLWSPSDTQSARRWTERSLQYRSSGHSVRDGRFAQTSEERGGTTPFNLLPIPSGGNSFGNHPASTPPALAGWWCRYLLPNGGVLLDPFAGSGTMLSEGLAAGASKVIGIEKQASHVKFMRKQLMK